MESPNTIHRSRKRLVLWLVGVLSGVMIAGVTAYTAFGAPTELSIKRMVISVQPEYDDPRILVSYEGDMADNPSMPQEVKFPVPSGSEIGQVCALKQPGPQHLCQLYQTLSEEGSLQISYNLPLPNFYMEYYYDGIKGLPDKTFSYDFKAPYPIASLDVQVEQPLKASNFTLTPSNATVGSGTGGFKYYFYTFKDVAKGQVISIKGSYTKADSKPSVAKKNAGGSGSENSSLPIIFTVIGAMIMGVVAWLLLAQRHRPARAHAVATSRNNARAVTQARPMPRKPEPVYSRRQAQQEAAHPKRQVQQQTTPVGTEVPKAAFCANCGMKLADGHRFCPGCGARIEGVS